jgi:hypothetical protein
VDKTVCANAASSLRVQGSSVVNEKAFIAADALANVLRDGSASSHGGQPKILAMSATLKFLCAMICASSLDIIDSAL